MYINNSPILFAQTHDSNFLIDWREHQYSLTDKLKEAKGATQLQLISQSWIQPTWWDTYLLKIKDELIFQREIFMMHLEVEYWYARSIIPEKCYKINPEFFKRLEKESIKNLIFNSDQVQRTHIMTYPIDSQCIEYSWVKKYLKNVNGILWVRLAEYSFENREAFHLIEILLPALENVS